VARHCRSPFPRLTSPPRPFSVPLQPAGPPKKVPKPIAHADPNAAPAPAPVIPVHDVDPYNISNDHHYEGMKHRVRQTFGSIVVQHAYPALKLQLPFVRRSVSPPAMPLCFADLEALLRPSSTRRRSPNRSSGPGTGRHSSSSLTSGSLSTSHRRRASSRTRSAASSARAAMFKRACARSAT
jgi:hypothetical protein